MNIHTEGKYVTIKVDDNILTAHGVHISRISFPELLQVFPLTKYKLLALNPIQYWTFFI